MSAGGPILLRGLLCCLSAFALSTAVAGQDPPPVEFRGTIWILEDGVRRLPSSGSLQVFVDLRWGEICDYTLELDAGSFSKIFEPQILSLDIGRVRIEGRNAICRWSGDSTQLAVPLVLEARFLPECRVRVRSLRDGTEFEACEIREDDGARYRLKPLPHVVEPWSGDITDLFGVRNSRICVRAARHASGEVVIDWEKGGDFWIELEAAATLELNVLASDTLAAASVGLSNDRGWETSREVTAPSTVLMFDGLSAGRYAIRVSGSDGMYRMEEPLQRFELAAGESRSLTLDLQKLLSAERTRVHGELLIDPSWEAGWFRPMLIFTRLHAGGRSFVDVTRLRVAASPAATPWDAGLLHLGRYIVEVEPFGHAIELDVVADAPPLLLNVPPMVRCGLRLIDRQTREEVTFEAGAWAAGLPSYRGARNRQQLQRGTAGVLKEFTAPRGPINFSICTEGYTCVRNSLHVAETGSLFEIELQPLGQVTLRLKSAAGFVPWPGGLEPIVTPLDGLGAFERHRTHSSEYTIGLTRAGRFAISLPPTGPTTPAEAIVVDVRLRETIEVVFPIVR